MVTRSGKNSCGQMLKITTTGDVCGMILSNQLTKRGDSILIWKNNLSLIKLILMTGGKSYTVLTLTLNRPFLKIIKKPAFNPPFHSFL